MSDGINGSLSERAEARREATEREAAHAKGEHAPGCHPAWVMCECGLAERLSAENADLRARLEQAERERDEVREEMKEAAGELLIPLPQSDPTVRKLLLANSIMRQERDAARADLERTNAEAAAMRETLESAMAHIEAGICPHESTHRAGAIWEVCDACGARWADDEGGRKDEKEPEIIGVIEAALSGQAGADLLVEVKRLREVERLAKEFKAGALPLENRNYHPRWYVAAAPLFAALGKAAE